MDDSNMTEETHEVETSITEEKKDEEINGSLKDEEQHKEEQHKEEQETEQTKQPEMELRQRKKGETQANTTEKDKESQQLIGVCVGEEDTGKQHRIRIIVQFDIGSVVFSSLNNIILLIVKSISLICIH